MDFCLRCWALRQPPRSFKGEPEPTRSRGTQEPQPAWWRSVIRSPASPSAPSLVYVRVLRMADELTRHGQPARAGRWLEALRSSDPLQLGTVRSRRSAPTGCRLTLLMVADHSPGPSVSCTSVGDPGEEPAVGCYGRARMVSGDACHATGGLTTDGQRRRDTQVRPQPSAGVQDRPSLRFATRGDLRSRRRRREALALNGVGETA